DAEAPRPTLTSDIGRLTPIVPNGSGHRPPVRTSGWRRAAPEAPRIPQKLGGLVPRKAPMGCLFSGARRHLLLYPIFRFNAEYLLTILSEKAEYHWRMDGPAKRVSRARLDAYEAVFSALAHPARRRILLTLHFNGGSMTAGEIAGVFAHAWQTT